MIGRGAALLALVLVTLAGCGGSDPADGRHFGYIRSGGAGEIEFDPAEFLTGEEARRAAVEDGVIAPGDPVENDVYVRNPDRTPMLLPLAADAAVTVVHCDGACSEGRPGTPDNLSPESHYLVTVASGRVVAIDEHYLP